MEEPKPNLARGKRDLFLVTVTVLKAEPAVVCREFVEAWTREQAEQDAKLALARRWHTTAPEQLQTQSIMRGVFLHDSELSALERKAYPVHAVHANGRVELADAPPVNRDDMLASMQAWWKRHALTLRMTSRSVHKAIGVALSALEQGKPFPTMQVLTGADDPEGSDPAPE